MATKVVGVLKEREIEKKHYGSPNKLVEDDSASRPARKISFAKGGKVLDFGAIEASGGSKLAGVVKRVASSYKKKVAEPAEGDSASRAVALVWKEKPASRELMNKTVLEWVSKCSKPVKKDPASRPCCMVCKVISDNYNDLGIVQEPVGCKICVAKAAALNRIKAAGGDITKVAAKEEGNAKPVVLVKASSLAEKEVVKTVTKEDSEGRPVTIVTVRVPYANIRKTMHLPPHTPLLPLPEDYFEEDPDLCELGIDHIDLRESTCAAAVEALSSIEAEENILADFFEKGYATLDLQVVDG